MAAWSGPTPGTSAGAEFEYRMRTHGDYAARLIGSSTNAAKVSKAREWSPVYPPNRPDAVS